jgi:hypothetical protein
MAITQAHVCVTLPTGMQPSHEGNDLLIRKFLKECNKTNIAKTVFDKSHLCKRFEKPSTTERLRKMRYKKNAKKANLEMTEEMQEMLRKKRKRTQKQRKSEQNNKSAKLVQELASSGKTDK